MANVKKLYADVTRTAKKDIVEAADRAKSSAGHDEEERLFAKFRQRAREDYRTLRAPSSATTRR